MAMGDMSLPRRWGRGLAFISLVACLAIAVPFAMVLACSVDVKKLRHI